MNYKKIETYLLCLLAASIFTSKPAIYISSALMIVFFIGRCIFDRDYYNVVKRNIVLWGPIAVFLFGVFAKIISPSSFVDIGHFFYKGMFFLVFPALVISLREKTNRQLAFSISMLGFLLSVLWSFVQAFVLLPHTWGGERFGGFWDIGRWAEITTFVFAFMLPKLSDDMTASKKVALGLFLSVTLLSLIISGGRAGWIAASFSLVVYMVFMNRKMLYIFTPVASVLIFSLYLAMPSQFNAVAGRATSVTETTTKDYSNFSRILMWGNGVSLLNENLSYHPLKFLFGIGFNKFQTEYSAYLNKISNTEELIKLTQGNYSLNDLHNSYLDSANKMGFLYTLFFYCSLIFIVYLFYKKGALVQGSILIASFLILGVFYTNYLEFQTSIFLFVVALAYSEVEHYNIDDNKAGV
ncbi:O-antigen ligase family protein [Aeromonas veronii]|uniref:O-antigen ligase family protein n=1 Tax=Aeromonas veronii TaxID=654 RepID=UPI0026666E1D|nr:O-antigen ligase family protein [Aeromonas veronii]MDO2437147.1 O-antigen ligase family protein [Aeromonas veronii]